MPHPALGLSGDQNPGHGDPPIVSPNIGQLVIISGELSVGTIALTDDLIDIVRQAGIDPHDIDRMKWPAGASRHASIIVLLTKSQLAALQAASDPDSLLVVAVAMGVLLFSRMYLRPPMGVLPTENDVLYACEIVDERFFWTKQGMPLADDAFNVHTDRKMKLVEDPPDSEQFELFDSLYQSTTLAPDVPYTPRQILQILFDTLQPFGNAGEFNIWPQFDELDDADAIRDLVAGDYSLADLIDRVLRASGHVLVAYPFLGFREELPTARYNVERIFEGVIAAEIQLQEFQNTLLGGTLQSAPFGQADNPPPPNSGFIQQLIGEGNLIVSEVPEKITVNFPKARFDGRYNFNQEASAATGVDYVTERFFSLGYTLQSLLADPDTDGIGVEISNAQSSDVVASYWAVEDDRNVIINEDRCNARGKRLAFNYYARFTAAVGNMLFAGLINIEPWAGALLIEWIINDRGMMTRVSGDLSDPLLGISVTTREPLDSAAIISTGAVKALTRPDGGILLDSPAFIEAQYFAARITEVNLDEGDNPSYSAEVIENDQINVEDEIPIMRLFGSPIVYTPASIADLCVIAEIEGAYFLWEVSEEKPRLTACPEEPLAAGYEPSFLGL